MKKILLILEDFAERAFLSTLLKKVGWDVEVAQSEVGINNVLLTFSPDVLLVNAFGKKVKGEFLSLKLQSLSKKPLFYLVTKGRSLTDDQMEQLKVDGYFESPIDVKKLFQELERAGGIKASAAFQKLSQQRKTPEDLSEPDKNKSEGAGERNSSSIKVKEKGANLEADSKALNSTPENPQEALERAKGKLDKYRFSDPDRAKRNERFLEKNQLADSEFNGLEGEFVSDQVKDFRATEDDPEIEKIDEQRKSFVTAMFELSKKGE